MSKLIALPVERDECGCWTHPAYEEFLNGRDSVSSPEFDAWMKKLGLEWQPAYLDFDKESEVRKEYFNYGTFAKWQPKPPAGEGWFIGSIHSSSGDIVCIWLREVGQ